MSFKVEASVSMKQLFNTKVSNFVVRPNYQDVDHYIVYISSVLRDGSELIVKPVSISNKECLFKAQEIGRDKRIMGIEMKDGAIHISLHEGFQLNNAEVDVKLMNGDKLIDLGKAKYVHSVLEENHKYYSMAYIKFLKVIKEAIRRAQQKSEEKKL